MCYHSVVKSDEKLVNKFLTDRLHITVDDCDRLLTTYGYSLHKKGGSHRTYHKKGDVPVNVVTPKNTKYVKPGYIEKIIKRLGLEE
jgi:predicted RNA binding protein YcfA (HicA-like mRNA interferase family)